jgi:thiosulfate dehydrogenase (quinone) large subunit
LSQGATMGQTSRIGEPGVARFLFGSPYASPIWLLARIYLGYLWLHAGWEKITGTTGGTWTWHWAYTTDSWLRSSAGLRGFAAFALTNTKGPNAPVNYGWYASFLRWLEHSGGWLAPVIAIVEAAIGVALLVGLFTGIAAFFGALLTTAFGLAGIAGVNPIFLILEVLLVLAWRNAGWVGLDRFVLPKLGTPWEPGPLFRRGKEEPTPRDVTAAPRRSATEP